MSKICISPCLLGTPCRYDGRAKPADLSALGDDTELIPFCPEMAAGLGCPREPIELVESAEGPARVMGVTSRTDVTERLRAACAAEAEALKAAGGVDLFVLKARSPSCGVESPLHDAEGGEVGTAPGEWARMVRARFPGVPVLTEEQLARAGARDRYWMMPPQSTSSPSGE